VTENLDRQEGYPAGILHILIYK